MRDERDRDETHKFCQPILYYTANHRLVRLEFKREEVTICDKRRDSESRVFSYGNIKGCIQLFSTTKEGAKQYMCKRRSTNCRCVLEYEHKGRSFSLRRQL